VNDEDVMEERGEEGGESDVDNRAEIRCRLFLLMRQARKDAIARAEGLGEWKNESEDCRCCCVACLEIVQNWSSRTAQKRTSLYFVFLITVTLPPFPPPSVLFYLTPSIHYLSILFIRSREENVFI
jgi:hypothetical protein